MISALFKRMKRSKPTRPKLYYEGAHDGQVLPKDSVADSLIPLEPRFMFDAAGVATGAEVAAETVAQEQAEQALEQTPVDPVPPAVVESTERMLEAFDDITWSVVTIDGVEQHHLTPLSDTQLQILRLLNFSPDIYLRLTFDKPKPLLVLRE